MSAILLSRCALRPFVALCAAGVEPRHRHVARECARRQHERRGRPVAFRAHRAGGVQLAIGDEIALRGLFDALAEEGEGVEGHLSISFRDGVTHRFQNAFAAERCEREEHPADVLRAHRRIHRERSARKFPARGEGERGRRHAVRVGEVCGTRDARSAAGECVREGAERAEGQSAFPRKGRVRAQRAGDGQQEAQGGTALARVQDGALFDFAYRRHLEAVFGARDRCPQRREALRRPLDVAGEGGTDHLCGRVRERRRDEQPVRVGPVRVGFGGDGIDRARDAGGEHRHFHMRNSSSSPRVMAMTSQRPMPRITTAFTLPAAIFLSWAMCSATARME